MAARDAIIPRLYDKIEVWKLKHIFIYWIFIFYYHLSIIYDITTIRSISSTQGYLLLVEEIPHVNLTIKQR